MEGFIFYSIKQYSGKFSIGLMATGAICLAIITGSVIISKRGGFKKRSLDLD